MSLKKVSTFSGHRGKVTALVSGYNDRSTALLSGGDDNTIRLWDTRTNKTTHAITGFHQETKSTDEIGITSVGFIGTHGLIAAAGSTLHMFDQRTLKIVNPVTTNRRAEYKNDGNEIQGTSTRGDFVAFVDENGFIGIIDTTDSSVNRFEESHDALASCVCFHPDLPEIASGGFDQQVLIWDMAEDRVVKRISAGSDGIRGSSRNEPSTRLVNPPFVYTLDYWNVGDCENTRMLACGHADGSVTCIDGDEVFWWPDLHGYSISALQFVRSRSDVMATAGLDRTVRLWNAESLFSHESEAQQLAIFDGLVSKPDTLATPETLPVVYFDDGKDIVACALD